MATDDLAHLRSELPDVFADQRLPQEWEEDWLFVPIIDPEASTADAETEKGRADGAALIESSSALPRSDLVLPDYSAVLAQTPVAAGQPARPDWGRKLPPPDAFAFYLPYHYFYPTWWGVYIVLEYALELARYVVTETRDRLTLDDALVAVRIFLYAHEAFHHNVEAFATRLEITHRQPFYKMGFQSWFERTADSDFSLEELLATAHGYRRVRERFSRGDRTKRDLALGALRAYIDGCPPGYKRAPEAFASGQFEAIRGEFAELNHLECLPRVPSKAPWLWTCFPHAFSGTSRVTSRVNYVIRRDSALASRMSLNLRYLRYRELAEKLRRVAHCEPARQGHGSHEIWRSPTGKTFPVPRHPGDVHRGLLSSIIKEAGLRMSISEFLAA